MAIARLIAESFHLLLVLAVVSAPLPMIVSLIADEPERPPRSLSLADQGLALLVLWVIIESLLVTCLGFASRLFLSDLLIAEALVFAAGAGMMRRRSAAVTRLFEAAPSAPGCDHPVLVHRALAAGPRRWNRNPPVPPGVRATDRRHDSLAYQLPRAVEWYQQATFLTRPAQWGRWINSYPYGWNTMFFLMVAPVGHDQLALLPNLAAWVMLGLATYGLARLGGGHRSGSLAAAVMVMLMPLSLINVHSAHNDLPLGALFLSGVYWSIRAWRVLGTSAALFAVACSGMTLGAKTSGVGYFALLICLWGWLTMMVVRERGFDRSVFRAVWRRPVLTALGVASVGVLGASWYVRNLIQTGNPLGFFEVSVLGRIIWKGSVTQSFVDQTNLLRNFRLGDWKHWSILRHAIQDFPGWPGMMLLGAALFLPRALLRRREEERHTLLIVVALCLASFYLYVAGPWSAKDPTAPDITAWMGQQMRYSFPFWGLLAAAVGAGLPASGIAGLAGTFAALDALWGSALYTQFSHRRAMILFVAGVALVQVVLTPSVHAALLGMAARVGWFARRHGRESGVAGVLLASLVVLAVSAATLDSRGRRQGIQESRYGSVGRFIAQDLHPATRIGFWGTDQSHLLYGSDLSRRLRYLALHSQPTRQAMRAYVRSQPVNVIAVGPQPMSGDSSPIWDWMENDPTAFVRVHGDDAHREVFVYRVVRGPGLSTR